MRLKSLRRPCLHALMKKSVSVFISVVIKRCPTLDRHRRAKKIWGDISLGKAWGAWHKTADVSAFMSVCLACKRQRQLNNIKQVNFINAKLIAPQFAAVVSAKDARYLVKSENFNYCCWTRMRCMHFGEQLAREMRRNASRYVAELYCS